MSGDPLKVLYCSFDVIPEPTGSSARATEILRGLASFNVDGLTAKSPDHPHIERYQGARLMRVPVGSGDLPVRVQAFERAVRRQVESDEYHLVHFTDPFGGYALCELREQHSFKLVYEVLGFPSVELKHTHPHLDGDRRFLAKLRRQELFCLMNADAVVVGSEVTASMVQGLGVSRERIRVVPTGVDLAPYDEAKLPRPDRTPMRAVYLGSQSSWQGLLTAVGAMALAAAECDVNFSFAGPQHPSFRLQLEEAIKLRGLAGRIELLAPVASDGLPKLLAGADVGLAPLEKCERNVTQGAPIAKIAHYLAAGRPVIASNLPMVREVTSPECALLHEPGDEQGLARLLVELARDPARRCAMGQAGRAFARSQLASERVRIELLKLYATLLAGTGAEISIPAVPAEVPGTAADSDAATSIGSVESHFPDARAGDETQMHGPRAGVEGPTDPAQKLLPPAARGADSFESFTDPAGPQARPAPFPAASSSGPPVVTDPAGVPLAPEPPPELAAGPQPAVPVAPFVVPSPVPTMPAAAHPYSPGLPAAPGMPAGPFEQPGFPAAYGQVWPLAPGQPAAPGAPTVPGQQAGPGAPQLPGQPQPPGWPAYLPGNPYLQGNPYSPPNPYGAANPYAPNPYAPGSPYSAHPYAAGNPYGSGNGDAAGPLPLVELQPLDPAPTAPAAQVRPLLDLEPIAEASPPGAMPQQFGSPPIAAPLAGASGAPVPADSLEEEPLLEGTLLPVDPDDILPLEAEPAPAPKPPSGPEPLPWGAILGSGQLPPAASLTGAVNPTGGGLQEVEPATPLIIPISGMAPGSQGAATGGARIGSAASNSPALDPLEIDPSDPESIMKFLECPTPAAPPRAESATAPTSAAAGSLPPIVPSVGTARSGTPSGGPPVVGPPAARPVPPPLAGPAAPATAAAPANRSLSPESGAPCSDEWLGHLLFGYAPFKVPLARRALTGEFQVTPIPRR